MKKRLLYTALLPLLLLFAGCSTPRPLPSEDIEVPKLYANLISVLKDPNLPSNSREKYEAARELIRKVDFTFTRETKTLNDLFYHGDAIIDAPQAKDRMIAFNYQYGDHFVRLSFYTYQEFVFRVEIVEK